VAVVNEADLRISVLEGLRVSGVTLHAWCNMVDCNPVHVRQFVQNERGPPRDLLRALKLEIHYVREKEPV
jgi:hypothetical protein